MKTKQSALNLQDEIQCQQPFLIFEDIICDRGSVYSVSGGRAHSRQALKAFLKELKKRKRYAQATHNSWAARLSHEGVLWETKNDDGEMGAGDVILRQLEKANLTNTIVVVTRWFGGEKLQGDRFRHLVEATKYFVEQIRKK